MYAPSTSSEAGISIVTGVITPSSLRFALYSKVGQPFSSE
jgi:hypothetical protein